MLKKGSWIWIRRGNLIHAYIQKRVGNFGHKLLTRLLQ